MHTAMLTSYFFLFATQTVHQVQSELSGNSPNIDLLHFSLLRNDIPLGQTQPYINPRGVPTE